MWTWIHGFSKLSVNRQFSRVRLFATPWTAAHQVSLSITNSRSSLRVTSIESVMPSSHLILCFPLLLLPPNPCPLSRWCHPTISSSVVPFSSCPQSFPASGSFQMSQLLASGGQSIGVSASIFFFLFYFIFICFNAILPNLRPLPLPQSPKDCSVHLCLFCCLAYRVVVTIFLNSASILKHSISLFGYLLYGLQIYVYVYVFV